MPFGNIPPDQTMNLGPVHVGSGDAVALHISNVDDALDVYVNNNCISSTQLTATPPSHITEVNLNFVMSIGDNLIWIDSTDFGAGGNNSWTCHVELWINGAASGVNTIDVAEHPHNMGGRHTTRRHIYNINVAE